MKVITYANFLFGLATVAAAATIDCHFTKNTIFGYVCEINDVDIKSVNGLIIGHGTHQNGKTDNDVKMVSFQRSSVDVVPTQFFELFSNLEILDLMEVKMVKWSRNFLKGAKNLKRIWLAKNEITELEANSFLGASTGLEFLVLHGNKISEIDEKAFNGLTKLKSLELQNNSLTSLTGNVFAPLKKLTQLNLSDNKIAKIDDNVFNLANLEFLNLNQNDLTDLSDNLFKKLRALSVVHLQNNKITTLHPMLFHHCENLMEVAISNNELKEIPAGIFENNKKFKSFNAIANPIEKFDGKLLPAGMELLYLDETVITENIPEKLEIFKAENEIPSHMKVPENEHQFTTADK